MTYIHYIVSKGVLVYFKYLHKNILKIKIITPFSLKNETI